jgi:adenosylmethionine-8-amino-7-oxononanoate aminotransferase
MQQAGHRRQRRPRLHLRRRTPCGEALATETYVVPPFATPSRLRLTERLQERWLPPGLSRCVFASGGSEGMDGALRVARQHHLSAGRPSRWKVLGRELSYHGTTLATLAVGGHAKRRVGFEPYLFDAPKAPTRSAARSAAGGAAPRLRRRGRGLILRGAETVPR